MSRFILAAVLLVIASPAWAQTTPARQPLAQLKRYLQLTDAQVQAVLDNNDDYNRWFSEKQAHIRQVQREILEETAREPVDSNALGIRYADIEATCREIRDEAAAYRTKNGDILTDAQRARLKTLEDALKLAPMISEAQSGNLLGGASGATPLFFTSPSVNVAESVLGTTASLAGCLATAALTQANRD
jgi:hypothetical protein